MELTLNNLKFFLKEKFPYEDLFNDETIIRDGTRICPIDGDDVICLFEDLSKEFHVSFEEFDFQKYFLEESELNTFTWRHLLKLKKQRIPEEELTIKMLFEFMGNNKKNTLWDIFYPEIN
ncbi:DUF1493 family protein [Emticicia sp. TH156]|uniref:DUF1493 family protein n=1 Tax=Emticicia sp. TH156 TaxID=2067454 RepID=UPI001304642A|nr:DUF1493 family protein [Emticicia sp. TH156]